LPISDNVVTVWWEHSCTVRQYGYGYGYGYGYEYDNFLRAVRCA